MTSHSVFKLWARVSTSNDIDYQEIFREIASDLKDADDCDEVAKYIPELGKVDPGKVGIHLTTVDNCHYSFGDSDEKFSIQSIAEVLFLTLALKIMNKGLWARVGVEPSGSAFNSLVQLGYEKGIPRSPFINAGALVYLRYSGDLPGKSQAGFTGFHPKVSRY